MTESTGRASRQREAGAGTASAVAVIAAVLVVFGLVAGLALVLEARHRAAAAADGAALAAADVVLGMAVGLPCARAGQVAAAGGAVLERCVLRGERVRVRVRTEAAGLPVHADAVAGPPPDEGEEAGG